MLGNFGNKEIIYFDQEKDGEYVFVDGKWICQEEESMFR